MNEVIFGSIYSYTDLGLMLSDVDVSIPEAKRFLVDVPGRDGILDLTPSLTPKVKFNNRTITLTFVMADYQRRWLTLFSDIESYLHGKRFNVVIEPDTEYYWNAFCQVDKAKSNRNKGTIVVVLDADPYKYKTALTEYEVIPASIGKSQICVNDRMSVIPSFYATNACTLAFGNITKTLQAGNNSFVDIVFEQGNNEVILTGTVGTVTISYREGRL